SDKTAFNRATKKLKKLLQRLRTCAFEEYLRQVEPGDPQHNLWNLTRHLKRPKQRVAQIRKSDGGWCRSDQERADAFAAHLEAAFKPFNMCMEEDRAETEFVLALPPTDLSQMEPVSEEEVKEEVLGLNAEKSPGADGIEALAVKLFPPSGIRRLSRIYHACLESGHFPTCWKQAEVILIPKPGKPETNLASYRPISLLLERKHYCCAVFLDVKQAFDRVWHPGLRAKLKRNLPQQYYDFLNSYLTDRKFRVRSGNATSEYRSIEAGVPQGSVLGPILYTMYTADMPV
ncbi:hypothetical protein KR026_009919, partial [Drosophila bipectinata]